MATSARSAQIGAGKMHSALQGHIFGASENPPHGGSEGYTSLPYTAPIYTVILL